MMTTQLSPEQNGFNPALLGVALVLGAILGAGYYLKMEFTFRSSGGERLCTYAADQITEMGQYPKVKHLGLQVNCQGRAAYTYQDDSGVAVERFYGHPELQGSLLSCKLQGADQAKCTLPSFADESTVGLAP
jgi:hypothetical protein